LKDQSGSTALFYAFKNESREDVKTLIEAGIEIDLRRSSGGVTALMLSAYYGFDEVAKLLVSKGAKLDYQDNYGINALMRAVMYGFTDIADLLMEAGANY
jgi:uncharacterized protein